MSTVVSPAANEVLYLEVQPYRELPPVVLVSVVSALAGWGLIAWTVVMGRPLGALELPTWLAIALGLGFGVALPALFLLARMTTRVYADRVQVASGLSGTATFDFQDVTEVEMRVSDLRDDYSNRNVGTKDNTRVAYAIHGLHGTQLVLRDGRFILIGSKKPEELTRAIDTAWQASTINT